MAQTIKLRRSAVAGNRPTTGQLDLGELAINTVDGKIYFERSASAVETVQEIFTTNAQNSGSLNTIGNLVITGSILTSGSTNLIGDETITGSLYVNNTISGSISGIGNVTSYSTSVDSRLSNLQTKSASVDINISNINSFTASENTKNSTLATYTGSIDTKFSTLGSYTASVDTKFGTLGTYTASIDTKWNTLQNVTSSQQISIDALNVVSGSNLGRLSNLESTSASVNISVAALNTSSASQQISIDALNITSASLNAFTASTSARLSNIELTSASVNNSVTALNSSSASQQISIDALNVVSSSNLGRLTNLESTSASVNTSLANLNTVSSSNLSRLTNLESTSASVNTSITNLNTVSASVLSSLGDIQNYTSSLRTAFTASGINVTFNGDQTIKGNLYVQGTQTIVDSTTINLADNIIVLNAAGTSDGGLIVRDATGVSTTSGSLLWDVTYDYWKAGKVGSESPILLAGGSDIISGSSQLTSSYDNRYVISGSITQTTWNNIASKPDGIVSGSSQLTASYDTRYTISGSVQPLPSNLISSSAQITAFGFVSSSATIPTGTISGSSQLTSSYDTRYVLSGSITQTTWDNIANKPAGIISSSTQLEGTTIQNLSGSFTGSFKGDGSNLTGVIAAGSGVVIASGSSILGTAGQLNFTGSGVSVTLNSGTASISITGGSGGSSGLASTNTINFAQLSQSAASTTWSFTHNLDNAHPNITVYDNNNQVIQPLRIEAMTTASMDIVFSTSRTGYAVASIGGVSTQGTSKRLTVTTASNIWIFQHNIGDRYPVFEIFDSSGDVIIPTRIETVDSGQAKIYFASAVTGIAIASVGGGLPSISSSYEGFTLQVQNGLAAWQSIVSASVSNAVSASYILYSNVANKPTLVSGSSQVDITSTTGYSTFSSSIATSISASNVNITSLSSSVYTSDNAQNGRLSNLESKSASVDISISNINSTTASFSPKISNLESKSASVDISISNINSYTSSLKTAISLNGQDVTINGNLNVAGTTTTLNSTTLNIGDNIIELNYGGTAVRSGIYTKDATGGSLVSGSILWDATNDYWVAGISGSESKILRADSDGVISGSAQVIGILTSLNSFTASNDITSLNSATSSYETNGRGIISGSAQLPSGIVSSSAQTILNLPTGTISGSSQLTSSYDTRYVVSGSITQTTWDNIASKPDGIISGSSQLTSSYDTRYVLSGSITQTTWDNIASKPAGIVSGSSQVVGILSSLNSFTSSYATTGSNNFIGTQTFTGSVSISGSLILDNANIDTSRYLHSQSAASTTWTVNHSLEYDYPSVTIYDVNNKVIIPDEITRISNNQLTITFASAESGNAHVSVGGISNLAGDRYLYTQSTPASTWTITHALNYKYVNVDVYDNNDQLMLPQTVTATNNNTLTLVFATPTSGNATISKGGAKILNGLNDLGNGSYQFTGSLVVTGEVDAQNFNTTSDISLKTNLELIENSLDKVEKLNGYTFDWVENYNNNGVKQIGMIAQEVYAVQPELVTKKEILIGNTYEEVMLLDYSKVTSLLIGAVKELSEKVKQLENKIGQ